MTKLRTFTYLISYALVQVPRSQHTHCLNERMPPSFYPITSPPHQSKCAWWWNANVNNLPSLSSWIFWYTKSNLQKKGQKDQTKHMTKMCIRSIINLNKYPVTQKQSMNKISFSVENSKFLPSSAILRIWSTEMYKMEAWDSSKKIVWKETGSSTTCTS